MAQYDIHIIAKDEKDLFESVGKAGVLLAFAGKFANFKMTQKKDGAIVLEDPKLPDVWKDENGNLNMMKGDYSAIMSRTLKEARAAMPDNKVEPETVQKQSENVAKPVESVPEEPKTVEKPAETVDVKTAKKYLSALSKADHKEDVKTIFSSLGVKNFPEVSADPEKMQKAYEAAKAKCEEYGLGVA